MRDRRIGTEENAFGPTENRGVGADAERETENGEDRKAGAAPKHAQANARIHDQVFEPLKSPGLAGVFARQLNGPEFGASPAQRFVFAEAALFEFRGARFDVELQFVVQLAVETAATPEELSSIHEFAESGHRATLKLCASPAEYSSRASRTPWLRRAVVFVPRASAGRSAPCGCFPTCPTRLAPSLLRASGSTGDRASRPRFRDRCPTRF